MKAGCSAIPALVELTVSDAMCVRLQSLCQYDFAEEVSVEALGHVFEQSITDLERLRSEADRQFAGATPLLPNPTAAAKPSSKRKVEGISTPRRL